jgi:hypothetical protein
MTAFELWEMRSGNLMGSYETETQALAALAEAVNSYGPAYAESIALVRESRGRSKTVATGADLTARMKRVSARPGVPA